MTENGEMPAETGEPRQRTVLIVEDSDQNAVMLEMAALDIPGVAVRLARSGVEALEILADPGCAVEAVITDLNMPRLDGFELIRLIRTHEGERRTPIIVVSADTDPSTPERIGTLGVDAFFPKPFSPAEVRRKLEQLLHVASG